MLLNERERSHAIEELATRRRQNVHTLGGHQKPHEAHRKDLGDGHNRKFHAD